MPSEQDPGIAATARALGPILLERIACSSDALADDLAARLSMVAWEREEQIGSAQRRLLELDGFVEREPSSRPVPAELSSRTVPAELSSRPVPAELSSRPVPAELSSRPVPAEQLAGSSDPCLVRELREQPFEALDLAWRALRQGRRVHVESEADACPGVFQLLRELSARPGDRAESAKSFPDGALSLTPPGVLEHEHSSWRRIGVVPRHGRVALVQADADRELAAYVLARACLRRTGFDPRVVHRVIVVGPSERLERNLRRLWVGARMGTVDDEHAFAGPVDASRAERFTAAERAWRERESVVTLCPGGQLEHARESRDRDREHGSFLAPALLRAPPLHGDALPEDEPSICGPMLVVYPVLPNTADEAAMARGERLLDHFAGRELGRLRFGNKPRELTLRPIDRQLHGALLVERLPPGLPEPRP